MKTRNIALNNTPILINNICKNIVLEAPTEAELKKKVKEYKILLVRALTNKYRLEQLNLGNSGNYNILANGNYQASINLNFSGFEKNEITNPEKTLQYVKHLTALETKKGTSDIALKPRKTKLLTKHLYETLIIPIDMKPGMTLHESISDKQRTILEELISKVNLIKIEFLICKEITVSMHISYEYAEEQKGEKEHTEIER